MIKPTYSFFSIILALACLYGSELVSDEIATPSRSTENYEHWVLMCNNINAKDENQLENQLKFCEIKTTISVKNKDGNPVPLININVGKPQKSDDFLILFQVPNGVFLRSSIILNFTSLEGSDPENLVDASYFRCDGSSCLADAALSKKVIDKLFLRVEANVLFVDKAMQRISVPISLRGFKDAFLALQNK